MKLSAIDARETFPTVNRQIGDDRRWRAVQMIRCSSCGSEDHVGSGQGSRLPEEVIATRFRAKGWCVEQRKDRHLCPSCVAKDQEQVRARRAEKEAATAEQKSERSPAAAVKLGELYMMLSDAYEPARKLYKTGWSDDRIAKETGLAVEFVRARREQDFGPLAPPDMTEDEIASLVDGAAKTLGQIKQDAERSHAFTMERITMIEASLIALGERAARLMARKKSALA